MEKCTYDNMLFDRTSDGVWISRNYAMKGPTGNMMDKEVSEKYSKVLEKEYQFIRKHPDARYPKLSIIGSGPATRLPQKKKAREKKPKEEKISSEKELINKFMADTKSGKAKKKVRAKPKKKATKGTFNPFE